MKRASLPLIFCMCAFGAAADEQIVVPMNAVSEDGVERSIGQVTIRESEDGLVFEPSLQGLESGLRGFHIHENPDCGSQSDDGETKPAAAAGDHFDPNDEGTHDAPWAEGHLGDLPALYVDDEQVARHPVFKPDLDLDDVRGRALIVHEGGDNYASEPDPLGGGGDRVACGVIQ